MSSGFTKNIEINIASRKFPLKVTDAEESAVREIEKDLNRRIQEFQLKYKDMDKLDCVLMTLVSLAFEKNDKDKEVHKESEIKEQLDRLNALLDAQLQ